MRSRCRSFTGRLCSISFFESPHRHAHAQLTQALKSLGFTLSSVPDMPTAFVAEFDNGKGRTHGFCCEYDALKGLGQGKSY